MMYESYEGTLMLEANCLLDMLETGVLPACAKDLSAFRDTGLGARRKELYASVEALTEELRTAIESFPDGDGERDRAHYALRSIKPAMEAVRVAADRAASVCVCV